MHRFAVLLALLAACAPSPVDWAPTRIASGSPSAVIVQPDGAIAPDTLAAFARRVSPPVASMCPGSLQLARAGARLFAAWWAPRADSGARLMAARSDDDGGHWSVAVPVDTTDVAVSGCRREPPSIAADSASGYVHVAYALLAPEGPGLFFSHSMDRGDSFHSPVPIVYGERLGRTSVAADGDKVIVAFEDPNSDMPRIGLAISRTMGHIFEERIIPVSSDVGRATRPLAAIRGARVAVAWDERADGSAAPVLAVRAGTLR